MTLLNKQASAPEITPSPDAELAKLKDISTKERYLRKALIFLGVLILAYLYSSNLLAQQSAGQRISISQAVDFPNDI